ncbi:MAG: hypothetical protein JF607_03540 [Burkholderiales bacterium]|nr:hypothetical protein [Burkholderiales bacterium]
MEVQLQKLANTGSPAERLKALKWVVHLVADAHQPPHAGSSDDRGGNRFQVRAFGRGTNLHAVWDSVLIANWPGGLPVLRDVAASTKQRVDGSLSVGAWLQESCELVAAPSR